MSSTVGHRLEQERHVLLDDELQHAGADELVTSHAHHDGGGLVDPQEGADVVDDHQGPGAGIDHGTEVRGHIKREGLAIGHRCSCFEHFF